ncbi:TonB-dependent receptor [Teredinibacter waterburyi]|uniref:TonB-dependent receptor n=1 Tax=Teredinibacter waterburyi TaxID=1500538 RepID=A0A0D3MFB2_9GAMM|nr:TonB-dependent receptor [Teredinibacter waterburyi]AIH07640.1 TonB-dependent receptor [Teredinibacter waterburyi]
MGANPFLFKKKLLATSISSCLLAVAGVAAAQDQVEEEVIVKGIRASIESSVNSKRNAASVVDSITAEDIGKLPDVTISDSLQRIPGIQIRRSAGEGGAVNIRGLPQVSTQLNGESYLGANSITDFQPNFGDIPSQLFKGADVIKSPTASLLASGLSGTVNLKTRRPFDFDEGFTGVAAVEAGYGTDSQEVNPSVNGLFNFKGERFGVLAAFTSSQADLANYYEGKQYGTDGGSDGMVSEGAGQGDPYGGTFLGDNDDVGGESFYAPEGWVVYNKFTERERNGANVSFQLDLGEGFELVADYFYTKQDEWNRSTGLVAETKWANCCSFNDFAVNNSVDTGVDGINTYDSIDYISRRLQSYSEVNEFFSTSRDLNVELNYDNEGPLTASFRVVRGAANQQNRNNYFQGDLMDGGPTNSNVWTDPVLGNRIPGEWVNPNPNGFQGLSQFTIDHSGSDPVWTGFNTPPVLGGADNQAADGTYNVAAGTRTLGDFIADPNSYNVAAISSENNYDRDGKLNVMRADVSYEFEDSFITSVDVGYRLSEKYASNDVWHGVSNFYEGAGGVTSDGTPNPEGCQARWKATDVIFREDCQVGEIVTADGESTWVPWVAIGYAAQSDYPTIAVTDFGNVKGLPAVWTVDPKALDNVEEFHTTFYGNYIKSVDPGASYEVKLGDKSGYVQANFEAGPVTGNFGLRVVDTELTVKQNTRGGSRSYGMAPADTGDKLSVRNFQDVLPALNVAWDVSDDVKIRGAYSENMVPLNLDQWGRSLVTNYALDNGIQRVTTISYDGNPELDPWRSSTIEATAEWYLAPGSMLTAGIFRIQVDSFPEGVTVYEPFPDLDGVVRNQAVETSKQINGDGGSLKGIELGAKYAFEDQPFGIDANLTLVESESSALDVEGNHPPFIDVSDTQANLGFWFDNDVIQARIAYNYRSDRYTGVRVGNLVQYQAPTSYIDANISWDVTDSVTTYLNASNITGESEEYYLQWDGQHMAQNVYEPRFTLGARMRF